MVPFSPRQNIELFHLAFLRALNARAEDKALIALKGGCNLRFYFESVRYSEDIDFDVVVIAKGTLKNRIERLFRSPTLTAPLRVHGIDIVETSAPKQTDTTQRWKIGLRTRTSSVLLRTKIEFSRRDAIEGAAFERIQDSVLRPYGLTPSLATHYTAQAAIVQKIQALAGRIEPQARDVFDLGLLFSRLGATKIELSARHRQRLGVAVEHAMAISFDEYRSKVVAYLDPDQAELYSARATWNAMQEDVVARLEALG